MDDCLQKGDNYLKMKESNTFQGSNSSQNTNVPDYLSDLYYRAVQEMTSDENQKISDLLCRYQTTFSKNDTDLGLTTLVQHEIDTGDSRPIKQPPRRVPLAFADEERKVVQQMEAQGIIRKSSSPWASPIVLVKKKNGKTRCCIDYRRLNIVTRQDAFPLPRVQTVWTLSVGLFTFQLLI